jgi:hypothetical protein
MNMATRENLSRLREKILGCEKRARELADTYAGEAKQLELAIGKDYSDAEAFKLVLRLNNTWRKVCSTPSSES